MSGGKISPLLTITKMLAGGALIVAAVKSVRNYFLMKEKSGGGCFVSPDNSIIIGILKLEVTRALLVEDFRKWHCRSKV